jgi:hypothetical protein
VTERRFGLLLLGLLLAAGALIGGLFGYVGIGYACGGTDVSEASDHAFCVLSPGGTKLLWALAVAAPLLGGAIGRPGWLLAGALIAAGTLLFMLAVFASV